MIRRRTCIVCGRNYEYCSCKDKSFPSWYNLYCSEKCKTNAEALVNYHHGKITADEAKQIFTDNDLKPEKLSVSPTYEQIYKSIMMDNGKEVTNSND